MGLGFMTGFGWLSGSLVALRSTASFMGYFEVG